MVAVGGAVLAVMRPLIVVDDCDLAMYGSVAMPATAMG